MNPKLFASLVGVLEKWLEENCDDMDLWSGEHMAVNMAKASAAVVNACIETGPAAIEATQIKRPNNSLEATRLTVASK